MLCGERGEALGSTQAILLGDTFELNQKRSKNGTVFFLFLFSSFVIIASVLSPFVLATS
jgi:hypothetical protein